MSLLGSFQLAARGVCLHLNCPSNFRAALFLLTDDRICVVCHSLVSGSVWVPWQPHASEADSLQWTRRPRTDVQGPSEDGLKRSLETFVTALAMLDRLHLATIISSA